MISTALQDGPASFVRNWMLLASSALVTVFGIAVRLWEMSPVNPNSGGGIGTTFYGVPIALAGTIAFGVLAERLRAQGTLSKRALVLAALLPVLAVLFVAYPGRLGYRSSQCVVGNDFDSCRPSKGFLDVALGASAYHAMRDLIIDVSHENGEFVLHECRTSDWEETAWWLTNTEFCAVAIRRGYVEPAEICPLIPIEQQDPVGWWCDVGSNGKLVARSRPLDVWF